MVGGTELKGERDKTKAMGGGEGARGKKEKGRGGKGEEEKRQWKK